ncbi:MAG: hypothetical protein CO182_06755 [Lysobacterales bacterium CG_4_9_14_3_um_filter_62_6]|nr:MAG: hypothetical protein CO182_06755 [Xanthomonadales bacterium CG_4_9_14_3_um_filter_62_6]
MLIYLATHADCVVALDLPGVVARLGLRSLAAFQRRPPLPVLHRCGLPVVGGAAALRFSNR